VLYTSSSNTIVKTRLAPTPSGYLHLGNALSFAITWAVARKQQGKVALRIDDLDNARFRPEYLQDVFDTISFMGIDYDEGPQSTADFHKNYSQNLRLPRYQALLDMLVAKELLYACPCSRTRIAKTTPNGLYPLTCRHLELPLNAYETAWRVRVPDDTVISFNDMLLGNCSAALNHQMPDFIVRRKDNIPAYQIASFCDDIDMGINLIVRGDDLLLSTAAQLFIAQLTEAVSYETIKFLHHPILVNSAGSKLSKSNNALSLTAMRTAGLTREELWSKLAYSLGWQHAGITDAKSFLDRFSLKYLLKETIQL
jgi:glutamyl/glutaminyl-tRNA synthetase